MCWSGLWSGLWLKAEFDIGTNTAKDVALTPCKTIVPIRRNHLIAEIKPATTTRIDLGLALKRVSRVPKRLVDTGGAARGDRITHKIPLTFVDRWLAKAQELDG